MQGKNFISAVHLRKARPLANANGFAAIRWQRCYA